MIGLYIKNKRVLALCKKLLETKIKKVTDSKHF